MKVETQKLLDAFDKRIQAGYGFDIALTRDDAAQMIAQAREFLEAARQFSSPSQHTR